ncbi:hypothetical protein HMPREF0454_04655 [Hafnia alvei ATCC 51873]|uniref:Uncharacterized protein n=1 Tax=Hafnia alvei ATCC 51873 TaxID=1002364 RepID=G9YDF7_HAFAL|nr:hypothetical protein HMPREF0454_04655 [Hafnia alvei ATCC 51873]
MQKTPLLGGVFVSAGILPLSAIIRKKSFRPLFILLIYLKLKVGTHFAK